MLHKNLLLRLGWMTGLALVLLGVMQANVLQTAKAEPAGNYATYLPVMLNRYSSEPSIFGVQMYGDTRSSSRYFDALMGSGADWVRVPINWGAIEPNDVSPADYNFKSADHVVAAAHRDGGNKRLIITIHSAPAWAAPGPRAPLYPDALPDFAEFVGTMVERYDGDGLADAAGSPRVQYWEFYNEPDANLDAFESGWGNDGDQYAQMLSVAYPAVKSASPEAQVVFGGIAYDWFEDQNGPFVRSFLDDVLAAGGGAYFDVMNFHAYPSFAPHWAEQGPGLLEKTQAVREKLAEYGWADKPIFITESGWHSNNPPQHPSSQQIQAAYVVELFTQALAADVEVMIWWMLHDPGSFYWDNGLVTDDVVPLEKLAFWAYQTAVSQLSTAEFEYRLTQAETGADDMEVYRFSDPVYNRRLYVAWLNPVNSSNIRPLSLPGSQAIVRDIIYGNAQTIVDGDGDGYVTIQVGAQPVYVEMSP
jgi:hypothetical protein